MTIEDHIKKALNSTDEREQALAKAAKNGIANYRKTVKKEIKRLQDRLQDTPKTGLFGEDLHSPIHDKISKLQKAL